MDAQLIKQKDRAERRWFINGEGQAFAVIEGPVEFRMGSLATETERNPGTNLPGASRSPAPSPSPPRK